MTHARYPIFLVFAQFSAIFNCFLDWWHLFFLENSVEFRWKKLSRNSAVSTKQQQLHSSSRASFVSLYGSLGQQPQRHGSIIDEQWPKSWWKFAVFIGDERMKSYPTNNYNMIRDCLFFKRHVMGWKHGTRRRRGPIDRRHGCNGAWNHLCSMVNSIDCFLADGFVERYGGVGWVVEGSYRLQKWPKWLLTASWFRMKDWNFYGYGHGNDYWCFLPFQTKCETFCHANVGTWRFYKTKTLRF